MRCWRMRFSTCLAATLLTLASYSVQAAPPELPPNPFEPTQKAPQRAADVRPGPNAASIAPEPGLIQPEDLVYEGAFRLPEGSNGTDWTWSGAAMTYCPEGDSDGPADGYPGSMFATGHNWHQYVSEISIPGPVVSSSKDVSQLNTATTIQPFQNIRGDLFDFPVNEDTLGRAGLEYLPSPGERSKGRLYFCWGQHYQEDEAGVSHGSCELDLSNPRRAGAWRIGDFPNYLTNDYIFQIPQSWAAEAAPGMALATGRFRDGGQGARGPSLVAFRPPGDEDPATPDTRLPAVALLRYSDVYAEDDHTLDGYHHADEWTGGAWLTAGTQSAVIFVGTKGLGNCWYGFSDGTVWPDEAPYPPVPPYPHDARGWWSERFVAQIIFYNPEDLAAVARGEMEPHQPQPYATLQIDRHLFNLQSQRQLHHVGGVSYDRRRGLLYVMEFQGDEDKPLVHVWRVSKQ